MGMNATEIPHTLKSLRIARGLTVDQLAAAADMSRRNVLDIEAARTVPSIDTAARHAAALGVSREEYAVAYDVQRARRAGRAA